MTKRGGFIGQNDLGFVNGRAFKGFEAGNFIQGQLGKQPQEPPHITIFGVAPELPEIPDRQFFFVEPDRALG